MPDRIYDHDEAVQHAVAETNFPIDVIDRVLCARDVYHAFAGITPDDSVDGVDVPRLRKQHSELLPQTPRRVTPDAEATFIARYSGLTRGIVVECMIADAGYMVRCGICDPGSDDAYRAWAYDWLKGGQDA